MYHSFYPPYITTLDPQQPSPASHSGKEGYRKALASQPTP